MRACVWCGEQLVDHTHTEALVCLAEFGEAVVGPEYQPTVTVDGRTFRTLLGVINRTPCLFDPTPTQETSP